MEGWRCGVGWGEVGKGLGLNSCVCALLLLLLVVVVVVVVVFGGSVAVVMVCRRGLHACVHTLARAHTHTRTHARTKHRRTHARGADKSDNYIYIYIYITPVFPLAPTDTSTSENSMYSEHRPSATHVAIHIQLRPCL